VLGLFDLTADNVREMTDQLRKSIHALSIRHEDSPTAMYVTASIGVAIVGPRIGRSPEGAVQVADEALYSAKRSGRNCVNVVDCDQVLFSTGTFRRSA
jgi:diguanylate cyclase (GGDEF)-like protein